MNKKPWQQPKLGKAKIVKVDEFAAQNHAIDAEVWRQDSMELHNLAELLVDRSARFAWAVVSCWLEEHGQELVDTDADK